MGIYIPGEIVPDNCYECPCCSTSFVSEEGAALWCNLLDTFTGEELRNKRCPLVSVPDHGDLVEREAAVDAVVQKYLKSERSGHYMFAAAEVKQDMCHLLYDLETVIPEDKENK